MTWKAFLVFRPLNLILLSVGQFLVFYFLNPSPILHEWSDPQFRAFIGIVFGSALLAAAGYLINDLVDRGTDAINKPKKNYIVHWSKVQVNSTYLLLNASALTIGFLIDWAVFQVFATTALLLYLYTVRLQKWPVAGNFTVAFLSALSLIIIKFIAFSIPSPLLLFYAGFAFLLSMIREMVKDLEDQEGDRIAGYHTAAIEWKSSTNKAIIFGLTAIGLVLYFWLGHAWIAQYVTFGKLNWFTWYGILFVGLPFISILITTLKAENREDYKVISGLCKYTMYTGMMGMFFF